MAKLGLQVDARGAVRLVVAAAFLAMLGANLPGHLSYDSVAQLHEGHFNVRETWGPVLYAWLLGAFDRIVPGTGLYVVASGLLLFGALALLPDLRPRTRWLAVAVTAAVVLTPQVIIYQGIVWKDVMFANLAIAGMVCLAHAGRSWSEAGRRWAWLAGALVLLAAAAQVRQNGLLLAVTAPAALGWIASRGRLRRGLAWGLAGFVAILAMVQVQSALAHPPKGPRDSGVGFGMRLVQTYDLVGAVSLDRSYRLEVLEEVNPAAAAVVRARAPEVYSGERVDYTSRDPELGAALWAFSNDQVRDQWLALILKDPGLYLRVRWEDFRWLLFPPVIDKCLPIYVGVDAPDKLMAPLGLERRYTQADRELANYVTWFLDTPAFSHVTYGLISLSLAGLLLWRREPADVAIAALQLSGVAFAASFFVISIACDYRYLYFTDLAALVGLVYAALDPPLSGRRAG